LLDKTVVVSVKFFLTGRCILSFECYQTSLTTFKDRHL